MSVTHFDLVSRRLFAGGRAFDGTGAYSRIDGRLTFAVDPTAAANSSIVDLEHAPCDAAGRVGFWSDITLLVPADPARGNGTLILDVPNRGNGVASRSLNRLADRTPGISEDPGDGFLFRHGFSILSVAWQSDVAVAAGALSAGLPVAGSAADPIFGQTQFEMRPAARAKRQLFSSLGNVPYPPVNPSDPQSRLLTRRNDGDEYEVIPRSEWRFHSEASDASGAPSSIEYDGEFQPGVLYLVTYIARDPKVTGAGLLALRDAAAFTKAGCDGALGTPFGRVIAFGVSQTGRVLRHMLHLGLTKDEAGQTAIDGMLVHIAGAVRGEFNHRFATPSSAIAPNFGQLFPFAAESVGDPLSGQASGLFDTVNTGGSAPKVFFTNSSYEYWNTNAASLLHIDPSGTRDLDGHPDERIYLFGGSQHVGGLFPLTNNMPDLGIKARYGSSVVDVSPLTRAALVNLDSWLRDGSEPPASRHPRLDDGTAVSRPEVLARFAQVPDLCPPSPDRLPTLRALDLGAEAGRGIGAYPPIAGSAYPIFVSDVDDDLNEIGAVRLPDLAVPVGSHTGWNASDPDEGDPTTPPRFLGITRYFAADEKHHSPADPRRPIAARYQDRDAYLHAVRQEAARLVDARYLLAEDTDLVARNCAARYDEALRLGMKDGP